MLKKACLVMIMVVATIALAACGVLGSSNNPVIEADTFTRVMEAADYFVTENDAHENANIGLIALSMERAEFLMFYEFASTSEAEAVFEAGKRQLETMSDSPEELVYGGNYDFFEMTSGRTYAFIYRVDHVVIEGWTELTAMDEVRELFNRLKDNTD